MRWPSSTSTFADTQTGTWGHTTMQSAPTLLAGLVLSPQMLMLWRCLLWKDIASLKCSSLQLQKETCCNRTALRQIPEQGFKPYRYPLIAKGSQPFFLSSFSFVPSPDFHPQCYGWVLWCSSMLSSHPDARSWEETFSFAPMTFWKVLVSAFREIEINMRRICFQNGVFCWYFLQNQSALEKSPLKERVKEIPIRLFK